MVQRILFLDGLGCNPDGVKPRFLRGCGYDVVAPLLPDLDDPAALAIANRTLAESSPDVIVAYSRGGGLALRLDDRSLPRLLIAPSLRKVPDGRGCPGRLVILHSATDDSLPLPDVQAHLVRCGLTQADLRIVGEDHTMIDEPAFDALRAALVELTHVPRP